MLQNFLPFKTFIILFNMSTNLFLGKSDKNLLLGILYLAQRSIRALAHFGVTLVTVMLISRKNPIFSSIEFQNSKNQKIFLFFFGLFMFFVCFVLKFVYAEKLRHFRHMCARMQAPSRAASITLLRLVLQCMHAL